MQSSDGKIVPRITVTQPDKSSRDRKVGRRRAPSDTKDGDFLREKSRNLARAGTISEQLRRVQELALDKNDKNHEEEERRVAARAYAQKAATQEQLRRIEEDADQKSQARRESQNERQRNIEMAVNLAEQERQRRMKEDKQRAVFKIPDPPMSIADESGFQFQHMSLGSPLPSTVPPPSPFVPYASHSPSSPSSSSSLSPTGEISPLNVSHIPSATLPPVPASSPLFRAQSSSPEPGPPARKVRKTRTRGRSTNPLPRPDSPKMRRRARKNSRERQRRVELNDQFEKLSAMLSVDRKGKLRKTSILLEAISVIGTLRTENSRLRSQQQSAVPAIAVGANGSGPPSKRSRIRPRSGSSQYPRPSIRSTSSPPNAFPSPRSSSPIPSGDGIMDDLLPSDLSALPIKRSQSYGTNNLNRSAASPSSYPLSPKYSASRSQPPSPMGFPYPLSNTYTGEHLPPFPEQPIPPLVDSSLLNLDIDTNPANDITPFLLSPTAFSTTSGSSGSTYPTVAPSPVSSIASTISSTDDSLLTQSTTPTAASTAHHPGRIPRSFTEDSNFSTLKNMHTFTHDFDSHPFLNSSWQGKSGADFEDTSLSSISNPGHLKVELETIPIMLSDMIDDTNMDSPRTIKLESPSGGEEYKHLPSSSEIEEMETWDEITDEITRFDPRSHAGNSSLLGGNDPTFDWSSFEVSAIPQQTLTSRKLTV